MASSGVRRLELAIPFLAAGAVLLAALILVPMGWLAYVSLGGLQSAYTVDNFWALIRTPEMLRPLLLSLAVAFGVAVVCAVVAAPLAWLVARSDLPWRQGIRRLVLASFVTPPFLGAVAWEILAAPNSAPSDRTWAMSSLPRLSKTQRSTLGSQRWRSRAI